MRLHPHAAASVFDSWAPDKTYPDEVGEIRCCGNLIVAVNGVLICKTCDTVVDTIGVGGKWSVIRVKGRSQTEESYRYRY
jgi:hypothetical protein